jgi:2'-5' RNA ligase
MSSTRRLFIGIALPREIAEALHGAVRDRFAPEDARRLRFTAAADLHVTLVFLGSVDEAAIPTLGAELERAFHSQRVLELALEGTGVFPSLARPRVLWTGVRTIHADDARLAELRRAALDAARAGGVLAPGDPETEPFHPHVTVARVRERLPHDSLRAFLALDFRATWQVDEVWLFESTAGTARASDAGRYPRIERVRLQA